MANLGFVFKPDGDLSAAAAGHPASSRPGGTKPKESKLETKIEVKTIEPKHEKAEIDPKAPKIETPPADVKHEPAPSEVTAPLAINSNTHRASHARLARRMQSMGEAECPNMQKLWNGTRKDGFSATTKAIYLTVVMFCFLFTNCLMVRSFTMFHVPKLECSDFSFGLHPGETRAAGEMGQLRGKHQRS